jgi:hypothetical protein
VQVSAAKAFASVVSTPLLVRAAATVIAGTFAASLTYASPIAKAVEAPRLRAEVMLPLGLQDGTSISDTVRYDVSKVLVDVTTVGDAIDYIIVTKVIQDYVTTVDTLTSTTTKPLDSDTTDADIDADPANTVDFASFNLNKPDVADSVAASDAARLHPQLAKADSVSMSDGIDYLTVGKVLADPVATADEIDYFDAVIVKADTAETSDTTAKTLVKPDVVDSVDVADEARLHPLKDAQDSVVVGDAIDDFVVGLDKQDSVITDELLAKELTRPDVADTASTSDADAKTLVKPDMADSVALDDIAAKHAVKVADDSATTDDTTAKTVTAVLADSVTVVDLADARLVPIRQFDDAPATNDVLTITNVGVGVDSLTMNGYQFDTARFN